MKHPIILASIFTMFSQPIYSAEAGQCNFSRQLQLTPDLLSSPANQQTYESSHFLMESSALLFQRGRDGMHPELALDYTFDPQIGEAIVKLNPNCRWSDGVPITSENFIESFRFIFDPQNDAYTPGRDIFNNGAEVWKGELPFESLGIQALDDNTIKFDLLAPESLFLAVMSFVSYTPAPSHKLKDNPNYWDKYEKVKVVSGPYMPIEDNEKEATLIPNPYYCDVSSQNFDQVKLYKATSEAEIGNLVFESKVDIAGRLPARQIKILTNLESVLNEFEVIDENDEVLYYMFTNSETIPDIEIRMALGSVLDYDYLESNTLGYFNEIADSFAFRYPGYNPPRINQNLAEYNLRIDKAKQILNDFGYTKENPLTLTFTTSLTDIYLYLSQAIGSMLSQLPVEVVVDPDIAFGSPPDRDGPDLIFTAWGSDYSDPENFLNFMVKAYSSAPNRSMLLDLLEQANASETPEERFELLADVEAELEKDRTVFPVTWFKTLWLVNKNLEHTGGFYHLARNYSRNNCNPSHLNAK